MSSLLYIKRCCKDNKYVIYYKSMSQKTDSFRDVSEIGTDP